MLSEKEIQFYSRQLGIPLWDPGVQERLKTSRVFVAGAGGLGSAVIYYLASAGVGTITICDSDKVEISNLNRQILHRYEHIGMKKTDSARIAATGLNPFISIQTLPIKIDKANAGEIVGDTDLIIDCLDNFEARFILNAVSVNRGIPMIHAGVSEFQGQITFLHPPATPCLACFIKKDTVTQHNRVAGMTPGILGTMQALEAIKYLTGIDGCMKNRLLFWDGLTMRLESILIKHDPKCSVCGKFHDGASGP
ncbi:MAG: HesA/MoeB/ThiF family protein [Spirochaetes bacterium]|nr:HesA/MoeB/ThiF family protein [Spirochaetota bacterium]